MSLRQDGSGMRKNEATSLDSEIHSEEDVLLDISGQDYHAGINGASSITLLVHHQNNCFLNLIDSFQYDPGLFGIN